MLPGCGLTVQLAGGDIVSHAVDLVVGPPKLTCCGDEVLSNRVPHASGIDLAARTIGIDADDATDADFIIHLDLLDGLHIVGLAERDIELPIWSDITDTRRVVEAFFRFRNQFTLRYDDTDCRVRPFE